MCWSDIARVTSASGRLMEQSLLPGAVGALQVKKRELGSTGLMVSEVGFGGHSWAYNQVPDDQGGFRVPTVEEAVEPQSRLRKTIEFQSAPIATGITTSDV